MIQGMCFVRLFCSGVSTHCEFCSVVLFGLVSYAREALSFVLFVCFVGAVVLVLFDGFVRALALSLCFVRMLFWAGPLSVLFGFEV